jgi:hypothetical protein
MNKSIKTLATALFLLSVQAYADDDFDGNPLATIQQLTAEKNAILIVASPVVVAAKQTLYNNWLALAQTVGPVSQEQLNYFQEAVNEQAFATALGVQAADPNYPQVISLLAAPHDWYGINVPGSRDVFDNPDTTYRRIPIDPNASYVITGKRHREVPIDENYSLWDARSNTISNLTGDELVTEADGSFTITLDQNPATGNGNHIQLTANAASLFVRNTVNDWGKQTFTSLSVSRVAGPPISAPKGLNDWVNATAAGVTNAANPYPNSALAIFQTRANAQPVNTIPPITHGGTNGTLSSQAQEYSAWSLEDDEALVVTVNPGGAKYLTAPVYDQWQITTDYINHTQSLNNAQAKPNADGAYTFVIAINDPGVYNWIDTDGLHEGYLNLRWQGLPSEPPATGDVGATVTGPVKLSDLPSVLPTDTVYVTKHERNKQLEIRKEEYARRYATIPDQDHGFGY